MSFVEDIRQYRIGKLAIFDTFGTILIGIVIAKYNKWSLWKTLLALFILGEIVHLSLKIDTPITRYLK